jgi:hypothetical protein
MKSSATISKDDALGTQEVYVSNLDDVPPSDRGDSGLCRV